MQVNKYRNTREQAEDAELEVQEQEESLMREAATSVEEEVWKKRYGDARRHLDQIKSENSRKIEELEQKLDKALRGQMKIPSSKEEVEKWKQEYPEFARILSTVVTDEVEAATSKTKETLKSLQEQQQALDVEKAKMDLKKLHPDLDKILKSADFHEWLEGQSQKRKDAIYEDLDVDAAALVIDLFKNRNKGRPKVDRESYADAAKVVAKTKALDLDEDFGEYEYSESQIARESKANPRWFEQNEEKIMNAMRKGKILMDLSAAR